MYVHICSHFGSSCACLELNSPIGHEIPSDLKMATTCIEEQVLMQLAGHIDAAAFDIVRTQMLKRKGILGCLRKNRTVKELEDLKSCDLGILNTMAPLAAVSTTTGNCIHCIQDAGIGLFNPLTPDESETYIVAADRP